MGMTRLKNILTGSHKFVPIKREIGHDEVMGAVEIFTLARNQSQTGPDLPPTPRVNVPEVSGTRVKPSLRGGHLKPLGYDASKIR